MRRNSSEWNDFLVPSHRMTSAPDFVCLICTVVDLDLAFFKLWRLDLGWVGRELLALSVFDVIVAWPNKW